LGIKQLGRDAKHSPPSCAFRAWAGKTLLLPRKISYWDFAQGGSGPYIEQWWNLSVTQMRTTVTIMSVAGRLPRMLPHSYRLTKVVK